MPRQPPGRDAWWVEPIAAALMASALTSAAASDLDQRGVVLFVATPLVAMVGVHARTRGFLHAPERHQQLPLPLHPQAHWAQARPLHLLGLAWGALSACVAVAGAACLRGDFGIGLASDLVICVLPWLAAVGIEPVVVGIASDLGRRFPPSDPRAVLQRQLGGGWTRDEAVIHLYAGALCVLGAAAIAMPAQLVVGAVAAGRTTPAVAWITAAALLLACAAGPSVGRGRYSAALWECVPWLHETAKTLAGPPLPEHPPRWVTALRDPRRRLLILQWLRLTPVPRLRLLALAAWIGWAAVQPRLSPVGLAVGACLALSWVAGNRALSAAQPQRARAVGALPLRRSADVSADPLLWSIQWAPVGGVLVIAIASVWQTLR